MSENSISNAIKDRQFDSFGGGSRANTFRRVQDPHQYKSIQLQQYEIEGADIENLGILTNNRGIFLITNNGNLLYKS